MSLLAWINQNKEWVFSGVGVFIVASIIGAISYVRRRHRSPTRILKSLEASMGDFFDVLRRGVKQQPFMREFYIRPPLEDTLRGEFDARLRLFPDQVPNMTGKIHILENHSFLTDVRRRDVPVFRISEDFAKYLLR